MDIPPEKNVDTNIISVDTILKTSDRSIVLMAIHAR